ncbi:MAG: hypothetical protein ACRDHY_02195, partial [Anaerolineales bacterium]
YWTRLGTAGAAAAILVSLAAGQLLTGIEPSIPRAAARTALWLLLAGALSLSRGRLGTGASRLLLGAMVLADLTFAGSGLNPTLPRKILDEPSRLSESPPGGHRLYMPSDLEYEIKFGRVLRFDAFSPPGDWIAARESGIPNAAMLDGIASANNFDPLVPARYTMWMEWLEDQPPDARERWLALMDVAWRAEAAPGQPSQAEYVSVASPGRARIVGAAICLEASGDARTLLAAHDFDPARNVVLEGCLSDEGARIGGAGSAHLQPSANPNAVAIQVDAPDGGWLILSDTWYPGWEVEVDGAPARLYRADYVFRAVFVPPQTRSVGFRYRPWTFRVGAGLSLVAWMVLVAGAVRWRRRA